MGQSNKAKEVTGSLLAFALLASNLACLKSIILQNGFLYVVLFTTSNQKA